MQETCDVAIQNKKLGNPPLTVKEIAAGSYKVDLVCGSDVVKSALRHGSGRTRISRANPMKSILYRFSLKSASVALACLAASFVVYAAAQQPANNEEFARRQYDSGMSFLQNHRYAEALERSAGGCRFVRHELGRAEARLLQIAQYQLEVARDVAATQTAIDRLLKDYANSDSAPMAHVLSGRLAMMKGHAPADVDAALASFERVPRLFPGTEGVAAAGYYAGEALRTVHRIDEALDRYRRVRMEYPRSEWAARASLGEGYCLVQQDKATRALPEIQWVRQQFPNSPVAASALALNTIIYRLYVRPPAQPPYTFSGKSIGNERADYKDVHGHSVGSRRPSAARPQGRRRDLRRQGRRCGNGRAVRM